MTSKNDLKASGEPDDRPTNVRVEYRLDATIKTKEFNNVKPGFSLSADVPNGVHPNVVKAKLKAQVEQWMEQEIDEALKGI